MFMHPGAAGNPAARPFMIGTVLLLLFLSIQTDWAPHRHGREIHAAGRAPAPPAEARRGVHEKIIYELSVGHERLERENAALRQHVLDLRRGARAAGVDLNSSATFLPIPGLEDILTNGSAVPAGALRPVSGSSSTGEGRGSGGGLDGDEEEHLEAVGAAARSRAGAAAADGKGR